MRRKRVLITTSWLDEGDHVHRMLADAGCDVVFGRPADLQRQGRSLEDAVTDVDALVAGVQPCDARVLNAAPRLKVVARTGVGYDNVDVPAANALGIAVCTTPNVNRRSVAEFTIASLLNLVRGIPQAGASMQEGGWTQTSGRELYGKTLGVVGFGAIGRSVAGLAQAFGMTVLACDPYSDGVLVGQSGASLVELPELLRRSDAITVHVLLSDDTRHLINEDAIARMKHGAVLVNAARGGVVDEAALVNALRGGRIAGAALDTFEDEPLPVDSALRGVANLLLTPHIAGATIEGRARSGTSAAESVLAALSGEMPRAAVNADVIARRARL
ncbi:phosphoglycerate dehydrogenase [Streptomyces canus]|uniref:phosphoglycerate dehydrogenase n=1 Tax=Streptomyces canus TaxID=58343 RepID=UPI000367D126|nr:phosphoglycerate dehydrogenase [Streptomyces canus]